MLDTREERARFAKAIGQVALLTTKGEKPDAPTIQLYWVALHDFNIDTIEEVAERIITYETELIAVPPPGRWREIALGLFELRSTMRIAKPKDHVDCDYCQDTGFRTYWQNGVRYAKHCECRVGGVPIDESRPPGYEPPPPFDSGVIPPKPGETDIERRRRERGNQLLSCACCGQAYRLRDGWRCCAAPSGTPGHVWMSRWCEECPTPAPEAQGAGKHRCPHHCRCIKPRRKGTFPEPEKGEKLHDWAVGMGLRDENAPGDNDVKYDPDNPLGESEL